VGREKQDLIAGFLAAAAALWIFGWLADRVWDHETIAFDAAVRNGIHGFASPALTAFFRVVTIFGSEVFLVPFGALVIWRLASLGRRHAAALFTLAAAGGEVLDFLLKMSFRRTRPEAYFGYALPSSYSFPSGHSMLSACFFGTLAAVAAPKLAKTWQKAVVWIAAAVATLLIGLSRIYLGVHYPSDVVAGYSAAVIWIAGVRAGYDVWRARKARGLEKEPPAGEGTV
jgi:membrane-associated phospholipid phosphatase